MLIVEKIPLLLLVAASATVTFLAQRSGGTVISLQSVPISERIARAAVLYVVYLGKTLWPVNLAALYPGWPVESIWPALGAGILLALLTAGALWGAWHGQRWLAVGWFWYLGILLPTVGLVQVGLQVMADRFLYLPQIGLCMALVWGAAHIAGHGRYRRWLCAAVSALVVAGLMARAWQQTSYWRNSETLWTHTLACTSHNPRAHNSLGTALAGRGQFDEAIDHYRKALEIMPDYVKAHTNLGAALAGRGQFDEAIAHYRKALEITPDDATAHNNLGNVLADRGQVEQAIIHYRKALEIKPDDVDAHNNLGRALAGRGQVDEAIAHYRKALEIRPDDMKTHNNFGAALAGHGQVEEAIAHFRKALEIKPDFAEAHNNLGLALAGRDQVDEAITHFREALEIKPDYLDAHINLGDALAGRGRRDEALAQYQKALDLASARHNKALADAIRARIRLHPSAAPAGHVP